MWKLLPVLAVLANLILTVTSERDTHTIITVKNTAEAGSLVAESNEGNGTAAAGAAAAASSSTIIEKHHHHKNKKCAVNEKYVKCPEKLCQPQVCEHVGFPQCPSHEKKYNHVREQTLSPDAGTEEPCPGLPACVCIHNYVRNHDGICMPAKNCPSCGNDNNATYGCGINCGRRCANYDKSPVKCAEKCYDNSCDCKKDYVFDDVTGHCVLPEDCSNKNPSEPEGTEGTPGNGEDEDTDPCDDCGEDCDVRDTTNSVDGGESTCATKGGDDGEVTNDPNEGDNSTSTTSKSSENSTTSQATNRPKRSTTTSSKGSSTTTEEKGKTQNNEDMSALTENSESSEESSSSTTGSEVTTKGSDSEETTEGFGMETATKGSGIKSATHKHKTTTTEPTGGLGSSADGSEMTTKGSGSEETTEGSGMETATKGSGIKSATHKHKKTTTESTGDPGSSADGSEMTTKWSGSEGETEGSGMETATKGSGIKSATHKHKKTTTDSTGGPGSSADGSEMTTKGSGSEEKTEGSGMEKATKGSGIKSATHKHKKPTNRITTTTESTGEPDSSADGLEMTTKGSGSEETTEGSGMKTTTKGSGSEETTEGSGMETATKESGIKSATHKHKKTTTESTGGPGSSADGSEMTTKGSGSEETTEGSGMETATKGSGIKSATHKHKKTTTESTGGPGSSADGSEMTTKGSGSEEKTEGSGMETATKASGIKSATHKHKKPTTESTKGPGSSTDGSEMTTKGSGSEETTEGSGMETTTKGSGIKSKTHKHKKTTTESIGGPGASADGSEMTTKGSGSEEKTEGSGMETATKESGSEETTEGSGMETATKESGIKSATHKHKKTTTESTGGPGSSADGSELTTKGSGSEEKTEGSGMETATKGSGIKSANHKHKKPTKRITTTTESTGEPDSSADGSEMTTKGSGSEETTEGSEMETTTKGSGSEEKTEGSGIKSAIHKHKKTTTESTGEPDSSADGSEMTTKGSGSEKTTEGSGMETTTKVSGSEETTGESGMETATKGSGIKSATHKHKKTTTESTGGSGSSADGSEMTTKGSGSEEKTEVSGMETATKGSGIKSPTHKHKKTTTESTGGPGSSADGSEMTTKGSGSRTTGGSEMETAAGSKTTTMTEESNVMTTIGDSGNTTMDGAITTTDGQSTTERGPKDCKGRNEWYYLCAPSCPQKTCADYLNGVECPITIGLLKCKPECRCLIGYYTDEEGNCLSIWECRRRARSTTNSMAPSSTTANPDNQDTSTSTTKMMSTTPEPNCEDVANELFVIGNIAYTTKLLIDQSDRNPGNNVLVGGASILYLFAQLVLEATGIVKKEILYAMNLKNTEQMCRCGGKANLSYLLMAIFKQDIVLEQARCLLPKISANLTAVYPDIEYNLFCKIYASEDYALKAEFIQRTTQLFGMGPENLNFSSLEAVQKINSDVAQYTNDRFLNYIKPSTLSALHGLVFVDAEDFQGKWEKQFKTTDTTLQEFYWQGRIDKIPTMYQRGSFLYADSAQLNAKVVKLKYTGGRYVFVLILPNTVYGLEDTLKSMENPENTASTFDSMRYKDVEVYLPKINETVANKLKVSTEMAKIKEIFNNSTTGLENIGSAKPPYVASIVQKINFYINEHGMGDKLDPDFSVSDEDSEPSKFLLPYTVKANHAFVYMLIFDKIVVHAGVFEH